MTISASDWQLYLIWLVKVTSDNPWPTRIETARLNVGGKWRRPAIVLKRPALPSSKDPDPLLTTTTWLKLPNTYTIRGDQWPPRVNRQASSEHRMPRPSRGLEIIELASLSAWTPLSRINHQLNEAFGIPKTASISQSFKANLAKILKSQSVIVIWTIMWRSWPPRTLDTFSRSVSADPQRVQPVQPKNLRPP